MRKLRLPSAKWTTAIGLLALFLAATVWFLTRRSDETVVAYLREQAAAATEDKAAVELTREIARFESAGLPVLVELLDAPRNQQSLAARELIGDQLARWRLLDRAESSPKAARLARLLARQSETFSPQARRTAADFATSLLLWPIDSQAINGSELAADCERVLRAAAGAREPVGETTNLLARTPSAHLELDSADTMPGGELPLEVAQLPTLPQPFLRAVEPVHEGLIAPPETLSVPETATAMPALATDPEPGLQPEPGLTPESNSPVFSTPPASRPAASTPPVVHPTAGDGPRLLSDAASATPPVVPPAGSPFEEASPSRPEPALPPRSFVEERRDAIRPLSLEQEIDTPGYQGASDLAVIRDLAGDNPTVAAAARLELEQRGLESHEIKLAARFADPDPDRRIAFARSLPGSKGINARLWLLRLSHDPDVQVRRTVVSLLASGDHPSITERFRELAAEEADPMLRLQLQNWLRNRR